MAVGKSGVAALLALGLAAPAAAQDKDAPPAILQSIEGCRAIADDAQRLACFDRVSAELSAAVEKKDVVVLDRKTVQETRRGLFGFSLPKLRLFGGGRDDEREDEDEIKELETTIRSAQDIGYRQYRIVTAEGAVWVTSEPIMGLRPKAGQPLRIKRGALGSYTLSVNGRAAVKARREG